jgi:hypothetical protein
MKRIILIALAPFALAGCSTHNLAGAGAAAADIVGVPPPTVIASRTVADEKALTLLSKSVTTVALASSALVKAGVITAGSPRAIGLANKLDLARDLVNLAATARDAQSYSDALARLGPVIADIQTALTQGN